MAVQQNMEVPPDHAHAGRSRSYTWSPEPTPRNSHELHELSQEDLKRLRDMPSGNTTQTQLASDSEEDLELQKKKTEGSGSKRLSWRKNKIPLRDRLHHFTWAWFTLTMSTGGLSLLIYAQPFQFTGLKTIGLVVYIINIVLFISICTGMFLRFVFHRGSFVDSLKHEREGFFFPTFWLSLATLITSTERYVINDTNENLLWAIQIAFWAYAICTFLVAIGQYSYIFAIHNYGLQTMMPTWILPIFPIMLTGTIASVIADSQPQLRAVPIIVAGLTCQGLGLSVAYMMYPHMVGRLMQSGLPNREHRPGLFMCVGPPAFTVLALIGMANGLPDNFDSVTNNVVIASQVKTVAVIVAGFLWALSLWWFFIALIAVLRAPPKYFHLGWWAMVFPNTGLVLATIAMANEFNSLPAKYVSTVMSFGILFAYIFVLQAHARAVFKQDIMYPGRDEDADDH